MQRVRSGRSPQLSRQSHHLVINDFFELSRLDLAALVQKLAMDIGDKLAANSLLECERKARQLSAHG